MKDPKDPRGNLLKVKHLMSGHTKVTIDNGPFSTITVVTPTELLSDLLDTGTDQIREHLMTRKPGHFRKKGYAPPNDAT